MAKNLIPDVCKLLGVEVGEKFKIDKTTGIYKITKQGGILRKSDISEKWIDYNCYFDELFTATYKIVKLPWKPKRGDTYYSFANFGGTWEVDSYLWKGSSPIEYALIDKGWVYRTKEAAQAALPDVAKELGVEYDL